MTGLTSAFSSILTINFLSISLFPHHHPALLLPPEPPRPPRQPALLRAATRPAPAVIPTAAFSGSPAADTNSPFYRSVSRFITDGWTVHVAAVRSVCVRARACPPEVMERTRHFTQSQSFFFFTHKLARSQCAGLLNFSLRAK